MGGSAAAAGDGPLPEALRRKYETHVLPFLARGRPGILAGSGGVTLRYLRLEAATSRGTRGTSGIPGTAGTRSAPSALVLLPGKGETYLKYAELLYDLRELPLSLYALDLRGMGQSDRLLEDRTRVHVERFADYVADLEIFLETVVRAQGHGRVVLLGHSTGALIAARFLQEHPGSISAAVLCSPAFELDFGILPTGVVRLLARGLDRPGAGSEYAPGQERFQRPAFGANRISHNLARWQLWEQRLPAENPELVLGGVTRRWLREMIEAGALALSKAQAVHEPLLVLSAGRDRIVRPRSHRRFCRRCPSCALLSLPEARHEILIEADRFRNPALEGIMSFVRDTVGR